MDTTPSTEAWWRVVETYGVHRTVGGVRQVVAREETFGPYKSEAQAQRAVMRLSARNFKNPNLERIPGIFSIEKGTIQWQET